MYAALNKVEQEHEVARGAIAFEVPRPAYAIDEAIFEEEWDAHLNPNRVAPTDVIDTAAITENKKIASLPVEQVRAVTQETVQEVLSKTEAELTAKVGLCHQCESILPSLQLSEHVAATQARIAAVERSL